MWTRCSRAESLASKGIHSNEGDLVVRLNDRLLYGDGTNVVAVAQASQAQAVAMAAAKVVNSRRLFHALHFRQYRIGKAIYSFTSYEQSFITKNLQECVAYIPARFDPIPKFAHLYADASFRAMLRRHPRACPTASLWSQPRPVR
jgi:hypothetical protein